MSSRWESQANATSNQINLFICSIIFFNIWQNSLTFCYLKTIHLRITNKELLNELPTQN